MEPRTQGARKIIEIDEKRCNGCGLCVPNCREGALQIVNGKAKLTADRYCDGLGACLGHCPQDAIRIVERPADAFDEEAVAERQRELKTGAPAPWGGCPSARAIDMTERLRCRADRPPQGADERDTPSELMNWPVQLSLVPVDAPYFKGANLLIAADCAGFSLPDFHEKLLAGKVLVIACPKLDSAQGYAEKLGQIFRQNDITSLTVTHMEVPCCFGLKMIIETALESAGKKIPVNEIVVTIEGKTKTMDT